MIRKITKNDKQIFLELTDKFYKSDAVLHDIPNKNHVAAFEHMVNDALYMDGYIVESDGKPVGYAIVSKTFSHEAGGIVYWLEELYILPDYRNKSLGKQFFDFINNQCDDSVSRLRLEVEPENHAAVRLYLRQGFKKLEYVQYIKELNI